MNGLKDYIIQVCIKQVHKRKSTYFLASTVVCALIALIVYLSAGTNVFNPDLESSVIGFLVAGLVLCVVVAFVPYKLAYIVIYAMFLMSCFEYIASQVNLISNVLVGIDNNTFPAAFFVIIIFTIIAAALSIVGMALLKEQQKTDNPGRENAVAATEEKSV